jgi:hypothetical protein
MHPFLVGFDSFNFEFSIMLILRIFFLKSYFEEFLVLNEWIIQLDLINPQFLQEEFLVCDIYIMHFYNLKTLSLNKTFMHIYNHINQEIKNNICQ